MHIVSLNRIIRTGAHVAEKGKVTVVPDDIGKIWVDAKFARLATEAEVKKATPVEASAKTE